MAKSSVWRRTKLTVISTLCFCVLMIGAQQAAHAVSPELKEGIQAYNKGDFKLAIGKLGAALSTDFNNAVLHYYMASALAHTKQNDAAIREFRIAYALAPNEEVGKFSKQALIYLGAETDSNAVAKEKEPKMPPPPKPDPLMQQALQSMRKQSNQATSYEQKLNQFLAEQAEQQAREQYERTRTSIINDNTVYGRRGRVYQLPMPLDSQRMLERMRESFNMQRNSRMRNNQVRTQEIQRSAENLEGLLNEDRSRKGPKLVPQGTNLYTRNYKHPQKQNDTGGQ